MNKIKTAFIPDNISFRTLGYLIIILGVIIRLLHLYFNRSLWLDEAMLANNIVNRSFSELLQPLDNRQIAPIGFILVQKLMIIIFGVNDYSLRLFPTLAGIFSIFVFYFLLKKIAGEKFAAGGLLIFVLGSYLIFHSTEAKQYGMDVVACITAFYYLYFRITDFKIGNMLTCGVIGAVLIWFSHCTIFFLTSIAIALAIEVAYSRKYNNLKGLLIMGFIWFASFGVNYYFFLKGHSSQSIQEEVFSFTGYLPPEGSFYDKLEWIILWLDKSVTYPIFIGHLTRYLIILILIGLWYIIKSRQFKILALGLPIGIHIVLTLLNKYPFGDRFNLYYAPFIIVFTILGVKFISQKISIDRIPVSGLIIFFLVISPARFAFTPILWEEIKSSLSYIHDNIKKDEVVYVYHYTKHAFEFYRDKYALPNKVIEGTHRFESELDTVYRNRNVWLLMTHYGDDERKILNKYRESGHLINESEYGGGYAGLLTPLSDTPLNPE